MWAPNPPEPHGSSLSELTASASAMQRRCLSSTASTTTARDALSRMRLARLLRSPFNVAQAQAFTGDSRTGAQHFDDVGARDGTDGVA